MGDANKRGTRPERVAKAIAAKEETIRLKTLYNDRCVPIGNNKVAIIGAGSSEMNSRIADTIRNMHSEPL